MKSFLVLLLLIGIGVSVNAQKRTIVTDSIRFGRTGIPVGSISTSPSLGTSDHTVPTQKAIKTYVDNYFSNNRLRNSKASGDTLLTLVGIDGVMKTIRLTGTAVTNKVVTDTSITYTLTAGTGTGGGGGDGCGLDETHPQALGVNPDVSAASSSRTPSISVTGHDLSMRLTFTVAAGQNIDGITVGTINFGTPWLGTPNSVITPANLAAIGTSIGISAETNTTITIAARGLGPGTYSYNIISIQ